MNLVDPTTQSTTIKAVKPGTPSGAYADPAQMGAMIQKMYPQYANFDPVTLGQRWIDLHTPKASTAGSGDMTLQGPTGTTLPTSTDPNAPDLSGLGRFAQPIKPQAPQAPRVTITGNTGGLALGGQGSITGGAQLNPMTNPYQAPQQPQKPQGLSTFDISKAGF